MVDDPPPRRRACTYRCHAGQNRQHVISWSDACEYNFAKMICSARTRGLPRGRSRRLVTRATFSKFGYGAHTRDHYLTSDILALTACFGAEKDFRWCARVVKEPRGGDQFTFACRSVQQRDRR